MLFEKVNDFAFAIVTETAKAVETARAMVRDAEVAATAKRKAQLHTDCQACQAGLENFLIQFPDASDDAIQVGNGKPLGNLRRMLGRISRTP